MGTIIFRAPAIAHCLHYNDNKNKLARFSYYSIQESSLELMELKINTAKDTRRLRDDAIKQ